MAPTLKSDFLRIIKERGFLADCTDLTALDEALMCTTALDYFEEVGQAERLSTLCRAFKTTRGWSDCYAHVLVATGRAEVVVEPVISPWDVAPMTVIMREAGGLYTGWNGEESAYTPNGVASNGRVHDAVLNLLR